MGERPEEVEQNLLQKMFGEKSSQDIMYDAYGESIFGDVTGADVFASMSASPIRGRKKDSTTKVDLGVLSEDAGFDSTYKALAFNSIRAEYDGYLKKELKELPDNIQDTTDPTLKEQMKTNQRELLRINQIENDFLKYYELMKFNPIIAQQYFNTIPGYAATLSDPSYFKDGTSLLFQGDQ